MDGSRSGSLSPRVPTFKVETRNDLETRRLLEIAVAAYIGKSIEERSFIAWIRSGDKMSLDGAIFLEELLPAFQARVLRPSVNANHETFGRNGFGINWREK